MRIIFAILVLGVAFLPALDSASADSENWRVRLVDLTSSYGQETWKYESGYQNPSSPAAVASHIQNQTTSFYGAVGLRAVLEVEMYDPVDGTRTATADHSMQATIATSRGTISALVRREDATSPAFFLHFDLDGANNPDPNGRNSPPADPGLQTVTVNVYKRINDVPTTEAAGTDTLTFTYVVPGSYPFVAEFASLPHLQSVPDSMFRVYNDVGWDATVAFVTRGVTDDMTLGLQYDFGLDAAGQRVELFGLFAQRGVATQAGTGPAPAPQVPFVPGVSDNQSVQSLLGNTDRLVVVSKELLGQADVGADGLVAFTIPATALLSIPAEAAQAGLVVVAPLLTSNFAAVGCTGDCKGGPGIRVGASELVVPVTNEKVAVDGYELADPALNANQAPGPVREYALALNALEVFVLDQGGIGAGEVRNGDLYALVPNARSNKPLSGGELSPNQRDANLLSGNLPVRTIQESHVSHYRIFALVYEANDAFYSMTYGDRGYAIELNSPPALVPPGAGGFYVNITSRTTDYDLVREEPSFQIHVYYEVSDVATGRNETRAVTIPEGGNASDFFSVTSPTAGEVLFRVSTTSGDVLPRSRDVTVSFVEPPSKKGLADRIPGASASLALLAALVAVAAVGALHRRD